MLKLQVSESGLYLPDGRRFRCALGRGGLVTQKREGDGGTPIGCWPIRQIYYRADRIDPPRCALPLTKIEMDDGWCDDPKHPGYNRPVKLPFAASHEVMWRDDGLYDVVGVLGHNDEPPVPGEGSAIFLHVARPDYGPTEGCVALALPDLLSVLQTIPADSALNIRAKIL